MSRNLFEDAFQEWSDWLFLGAMCEAGQYSNWALHLISSGRSKDIDEWNMEGIHRCFPLHTDTVRGAGL